ncbi:hypothetical protein ANCDUO_17857 [Ancylostoma duodenale]|uniref:Uncharacterized protein n=1 Tax=Ancylostoma duodenale TaxID=51022 RepID=A0A0C2C6Y9_9BILA|nr:hypothetical protein ANCDUO_17857 [Ancylostoma duodenale]
MRAPNFLIKREAAKKRWNQVCENLHLGRIKIAVTESKLFSPECYLEQELSILTAVNLRKWYPPGKV